MDLTVSDLDLFERYLADFTVVAGDRRTATLLGETVRGIIGSESLICRRIGAFSPSVGSKPAR